MYSPVIAHQTWHNKDTLEEINPGILIVSTTVWNIYILEPEVAYHPEIDLSRHLAYFPYSTLERSFML